MQEYKQDPMASDSDDTQKIRQAEQRAIRKKKVKAPASFPQSSSSTISKAPSFRFWNASFQNGYSPPIPTKTKFEYNANNSFNNLFKNPFRFTRTPKVQTTAWVGENKATEEKTVQKFNSSTKQTELEDLISKEMIRKFEKVNKSFNSFKPLLSKVLKKARENSTTQTCSSYFEKWKIFQLSFQRSMFYQWTSFIKYFT